MSNHPFFSERDTKNLVNQENLLAVSLSSRDRLLQKSGINKNSRVLDLGCGNGNAAAWLAETTGCDLTWLDISKVREKPAFLNADNNPDLKLSFQNGTAIELPFADGSFTHVISLSVVSHIPERQKALAEIHRVLVNEGVFMFDDLVIASQSQRKWASEELLISAELSYQAYAANLHTLGFLIFEEQDLSQDLLERFEILSTKSLSGNSDLAKDYQSLLTSVKNHHISWHFFSCRKINDLLEWIYRAEEKNKLQEKYAVWAKTYDSDVDEPYRISPLESAKALAGFLPDKMSAIVDMGAGTGMVGEALYQMGYHNLFAVDLTQEMLEVAKSKQVYKALHQLNIEQPQQVFLPESFDAMIAVGVFTFGHASPDAIPHCLSVLKTGGFFALTVRVDFFETHESLQFILKNLPLELVYQSEFYIYNTEKMYALVFKKTSS